MVLSRFAQIASRVALYVAICAAILLKVSSLGSLAMNVTACTQWSGGALMSATQDTDPQVHDIDTRVDVEAVGTETSDTFEEEHLQSSLEPLAIGATRERVQTPHPERVVYARGAVSRPWCYLSCTLGSRGPPTA
jgi:hypothetical protein